MNHPARCLNFGRGLVATLLLACSGVAFGAPNIGSFTPAFGASTDTTPILIFGSGFYPGTLVVKFNGATASSPFPNQAGTQIQVYVPATAPLGSGPLFVSVNGVETYSLENFTVIGAGPYISGFAPNKAGGGATITITGAHFSYPLTVRFNGQPVVASGASAEIFTVAAPAGVTTGFISVSNSTGMWTSTNFFYGPPLITGLSPTNGRAGTNVLIVGTNFLHASEVKFGGIPATTFTVLSNNAITAVAPVGVTNGPIWVTTPYGQVNSGSLTNGRFVVLPTITGFTPGFGAPGTLVTINGANLNEGTNLVSGVAATNAASVFFNGVKATFYTNVSFSQLTTMVPNAATTGKISVTTTNGSGTNDTLFYLPPRISGFTPATNPPGARITITGTNFLGATSVLFSGGVPSPAIFVTNNNTLGADVPSGFITGPISVIAPAGTNTSSDSYYAAPQVTSFSPFSGVPGDMVSVFGNNLGGATAVRFSAPGGFTNAFIQGQQVGRIDVLVPTNSMTGPISVVGPAGVGASAANFQLNYSTIEVTVGDSPDPAVVGSPLAYTIQVRNLGPNPATILVTNVLPASVTFDNSTAGGTVGGTTTANLGTVAVNSTASFTVTGIPTTPGISVTNFTTASSGPLPSYTPTVTVTHIESAAVLKIQFSPPASLLLSWPTNASSYTLQFRTNLTTGDWSAVPTPPVVSNGTNTVTDSMSEAARYYRLKR